MKLIPLQKRKSRNFLIVHWQIRKRLLLADTLLHSLGKQERRRLKYTVVGAAASNSISAELPTTCTHGFCHSMLGLE